MRDVADSSRSRMRTVRVVLAVALATVGLVTVGGARRASACSCMGKDLSVDAVQSDEVFTGRVVSAMTVVVPDLQRRGDLTEFTQHRVVVDQVKKGRVGEEVTVFALGDGDSCGVALDMGPVLGFVVTPGADGRRRVDGCGGRASAAAVAALSFEPPAPDGTGPPFAVVSGYFGAATLAVIDRELRPLGFGGEGEVPGALTLCADREHVATLTGGEGGKVLRVERRRIADLAVVSSWQLARANDFTQWWRFRLSCDGAASVWVIGPPNDAPGHEVNEVYVALLTQVWVG